MNDARSLVAVPIQGDNPDIGSESDLQQATIPVPSTGDAGKEPSANDTSSEETSGLLPVPSSTVDIPKLGGVPVCRGSDGNTYIRVTETKNASVLRVGTKPADHFIRRLAHQNGTRLKTNELRDINDDLIAYAELSGQTCDVWYRVAPFEDGIELDVGDDLHTRIRVTPGKVKVVTEGSGTLFFRTPAMQQLTMPADESDLSRLDNYLNNLHKSDQIILKGWITYTLAHPKVRTTNYPFLMLRGDQGSGKSTLSKLILSMVDPSIVDVQTFPGKQNDLAIAIQNAHTLCFDNMYVIKQLMADTLSIASTGGVLASRQLYTNGEQYVLRLHGSIIFNGIHDFISQPDLTQRCVPMHLRSIDENERRSEADFMQKFQADLPSIMRGMLDYIAKVLAHLPDVEVTNPERMLEFVRWLAAMEKVDGVPTGVYQAQYSASLKESMLDSLLENPLAAAIMSFISDQRDGQWSGTPADLYQELNYLVGGRSRFSAEWPQNPTSLSKRLRVLQAAFRHQGIEITLGRAKERKITITRKEGTGNGY